MEIIIIALIIVAIIGVIIAFIIGKKTANNNATDGVSQASYRQMEIDIAKLETTKESQNQTIAESKNKIESLEQQVKDLTTKEITTKTTLEATEKLVKSYQETSATMQKQSQETFENLAHKILKENNESFDKHSKQTLAQTLDPLKVDIKNFKETIDKSFSDHAKEQHSLRQGIDGMIKTTNIITSEAKNLTQALKGDSKMQGNWGEFHLTRLLEEAGFREDIDYTLQASGMDLRDDGNRLQKPDVVIKLLDGKHIIIDSKVSLIHYERYCSATDREMQNSHLQEFISSVENHVKDLHKKSYHNSKGTNSIDFVIMFMPIEPAYMLAMIEKPSIHNDAWRKHVVITSSTTLFTMLKSIAYSRRLEQQNQNTQEIVRQGAGLYDKFVGFVNDMKNLNKNLTSAQTSYDNAFSKLKSGNGNLVTRVENLRKLGVPSKKQLSTDLIEAEDDDDTNLIADT